MSVPLQVQLFDAFLGSQEGIHSIILPDLFSSGGSQNLWIDKYGRAKRILGYANQNVAGVTTNAGGSATKLRHLFHYKTTAGGSTVRREIGCFDDATDEWELHYSTDSGTTWTFLYDAGASSINRIPDFAQFGDELFIANGVIDPRKLSATTIAAAGATQSPTPAAAESSSSGNLLPPIERATCPVLTTIASVTAPGTKPGAVTASPFMRPGRHRALISGAFLGD